MTESHELAITELCWSSRKVHSEVEKEVNSNNEGNTTIGMMSFKEVKQWVNYLRKQLTGGDVWQLIEEPSCSMLLLKIYF